jgi:hypothetical protein
VGEMDKEFEEELLEVSCRGQEVGQVSLLRLEWRRSVWSVDFLWG